MINLKQYKLISFDMFQTLVDLNSQKSIVLHKIFGNAFNIEIANQFWSEADDFVYRYFHRIAENDLQYKTVTEIFTDCYKTIFDKYNIKMEPEKAAEFLAKSHNNAEPYPEALEVIEKIKKYNKVCIISDTDNSMIESLLVKFGINYVYSSQSLHAYKFDKSGILFKKAIKDFSINPGEMLHIGDGTNDVLGASLIGADSVWINRNKRIWTAEKKPTYEIKSLRELIE